MHCHILPGVDDGAQSIEEAKAMLEIAYAEGIRYMIATPHYHPKRGHESREVLIERAALVREAAHEIDKDFRIYLGTEIYFSQDIPEKLKEKEVLTMNRRNYILVEFSPADTYSYIHQSLQQLQLGGYEVILAHAERYDCLVKDPELAKQLWEMGIHLQVNAGSICEGGRRIKKFIRGLMDEDKIFCVGTDAHSAEHRSPRMKDAAEYVKKQYGENYMRRIFFGNAKVMLKKME